MKNNIKISFKKAFTLAEVMIVISVIGVLTAILLPIAFNSAPDENVLRFKKMDAALGTVIRELVNSDKYYKDGDLGVKADGTKLYSHTEVANYSSNRKYFCKAMADVMSTKTVNCQDFDSSASTYILLSNGTYNSGTSPQSPYTITDEGVQDSKKKLDSECAKIEATITPEIVTADDVSIYQTKSRYTFGSTMSSEAGGKRIFAPPGKKTTFYDQNGMDIAYKILCIDIDGMNNGEAPFGYGIRADGKILTGARADEWLEKSVQRGDD